MKIKMRLPASVLAAILVFSAAGCAEKADSETKDQSKTQASKTETTTVSQSTGSSSGSNDAEGNNGWFIFGGGNNDDGNHTETTVTTATTTTTAPPSVEIENPNNLPSEIPEGEETEIQWFSYYDLNPVSYGEKSVALELFETYGGKISYNRATYSDFYDSLAAKLISGEEIDMVPLGNMSFPFYCMKNFFQPLDGIIDLDSPLWCDMKDIAHNFTINGKLFAAPVDIIPGTLVTYNRKDIEKYQLDDPYELYMNGEWDWNSFEEIMLDFNKQTGKKGVNGNVFQAIMSTTGKSLVKINHDSFHISSNIYDKDITKAADFVTKLNSQGLVDTMWADNPSGTDALFFMNGVWSITSPYKPKNDEEWTTVPVPRYPESDIYYQEAVPGVYLWSYNSDKASAIKCWLECNRFAQIDEFCKMKASDSFFRENPHLSEQTYDLTIYNVDKRTLVPVYNEAQGLSPTLSDSSGNEIPMLDEMKYLLTGQNSYDGKTKSWSEICKLYSDKLDKELKSVNDMADKM